MGKQMKPQPESSPVKRYLTVYSNETEWLLEEYEFERFNLSAFREQFGIFDNDPLMYTEYPVNPEDREFVSKYLSETVTFDFDQYSYFVSCYKEE